MAEMNSEVEVRSSSIPKLQIQCSGNLDYPTFLSEHPNQCQHDKINFDCTYYRYFKRHITISPP